MEKLRVMIVDDESLIVDIFSEIISEVHTVFSFLDPREAIEYLETNEVDVLLTDYNMPNVNGLELGELAYNKYGAYVILMTGYSNIIDKPPFVGSIRLKPCSVYEILKEISHIGMSVKHG